MLLGILIHRVSGQSYGEFLQQHIFTPLGMRASRVISDLDIVPNRVSGYEKDEGVLKNQKWVSPTFNATADGTCTSLYETAECLLQRVTGQVNLRPAVQLAMFEREFKGLPLVRHDQL